MKSVSNQLQSGRQAVRVERRPTVTKPAPAKRPAEIEVITLSDSDSDATVDWEYDSGSEDDIDIDLAKINLANEFMWTGSSQHSLQTIVH